MGQTIHVINDDPKVLHNVHFMPRLNPKLNFGEPGEQAAGMIPSRSVVFQKAEMIPVKCDVHSWMHAVVAVIANPYFSVTGEDGSFSITNVPAGTYVVEAWHEKYGSQRKIISLKPGDKQVVSFQY